MFSKELENLIQATLEDGVLEDNEKAALIKRAQKEGVDLDELEIYINSLLQRRQRELREKNDELDKKYEEEQKKAIGPVCPKCHKQVPPLTLKCDCGYEFTTSKSVSSVEALSKKLEEIMSTPATLYYERRNREERIHSLISTFPVPNTKENIVEFLSLAAPYSKKKRFTLSDIIGLIINPVLLVFGDHDTIIWNKNADVWKAKFDQVLMKGRSLRGDSDFQRQLDYYENMVNKK